MTIMDMRTAAIDPKFFWNSCTDRPPGRLRCSKEASMSRDPQILRYLGAHIGPAGDPEVSDRELVERFAASHEESAFATLLDRYRSLVMGVCLRVLRNNHEAEDAFQATFVVLALKAGSVRSERSLGGWLHRVAYHVALRAKAAAQRRQAQERQ